MEIAAVAALLAVAGLGGSRNGWLDVINNFAPMILAMGLVGVGLAWWSLDGATRITTICVALIAVAYGLALIAPDLAGALASHPQGGAQFRILSANVWTDNPTPGLAIGEIIARDADAVFLQESNGTLRNEFVRLKSLYPYASECPGSGVQIFLKTPITAHGCGPGPASPSQLDWVWVETTASDGRPVTLATTHFSWPFPPGPQSAERTGLAASLSQLSRGDLILGGDFNTTPWSFAMRRQDQLFAPLKRRTLAWFSWPARLDALRRSWPLPILPIDHIYAGPNWQAASLTRLRMPGSDHFATEAVLTRRP